MTEGQWRICDGIDSMLRFVDGKVGDRKLRLFAAGCCRLVFETIRLEACRRAVEVGERFADGTGTPHDLDRARSAAFSAIERWAGHDPQRWDFPKGAHLARHFLAAETAQVNRPFLVKRIGWLSHDGELKATAPALLRCIVGPAPFRRIPVDPEWLSQTVSELARTIYDERSFERMPILGDALEDRGCDAPEILGHARSAGPHARGCWVVDLILGKASAGQEPIRWQPPSPGPDSPGMPW
jgi:hypothetical protein